MISGCTFDSEITLMIINVELKNGILVTKSHENQDVKANCVSSYPF